MKYRTLAVFDAFNRPVKPIRKGWGQPLPMQSHFAWIKLKRASLSTQPGTVQYLRDTPKRGEVGYIMLYKFIYIIYIPLNPIKTPFLL